MASKLNSINKNVDSSQRLYQVYQPQVDKFNEAYKGLAEANPYANVSYKRSWWQSLLSNLGFRTNYDAYLEGMNLQAQEYENALLQKQYDEEYNSPIEQANRERLAGLNPNLTGNISSGESSPLGDDGNPPVPPQADDLQMITGFAGAVLQGVQGAVGLAGALTNLAGVKLDNNSKLVSFAEDAILHVLPESYEDNSGVDWSNVETYYPKLKNMYGNLMSKRQFRKFVSLADNFAQGLSTGSKKWSLNEGRARSRKGYYRETSGSDYSETDEVMRVVSKELSDMALTVWKNQQGVENAKSKEDYFEQTEVRSRQLENQKMYEQNRNPSSEALQHNRGLRLDNDIKDENLDMLKYKNSMRTAFDRILNQLNKLSESGNKFAPIAQMVLSATLMKYLGE